MLGLARTRLAKLIGVTSQQAAKYERGINRISCGRLFEIGEALNVPVSYFFEGFDGESARRITPRERRCLELSRDLAQIPNARHREALSQLVRVLAAH